MAEGKDNGHNEVPEEEMSEEEQASIAAEMAALGRIFGEAISTAWQSEERYALQADIKEGLDRFIAEVDAAVSRIRKAEPAQKVQAGVQKAAENVKSGKVADEMRRGTVTALRGLSDTLERMASSFTPLEEDETGEGVDE
jgi:hypothetical protein